MTTTEAIGGSDEQGVRDTIDAYANAVRHKDLDAVMALYARDVVAFDMMAPLSYAGRDAYRSAWEFGVSMMTGEMRWEARDLRIAVSGDLAHAHALTHMSGDTTMGAMDMWSRWTIHLRRSGGRWLITHEHASVPLDQQGMNAAVDLQP